MSCHINEHRERGERERERGGGGAKARKHRQTWVPISHGDKQFLKNYNMTQQGTTLVRHQYGIPNEVSMLPKEKDNYQLCCTKFMRH